MFATYATYAIVMKEELSGWFHFFIRVLVHANTVRLASKIFSTISVFNMLRNQISQLSWYVGQLVQGQRTLHSSRHICENWHIATAKVSLDRFTEFLNETELLDYFGSKQGSLTGVPLQADEDDGMRDVGFRNATFSWSEKEIDGSLTPTSRCFRLHIEGELLFKRNCINMIVGPTWAVFAYFHRMHWITYQQ